MGLAITSNPCPTEHGPMGFPTVTHRVAYLGTRQPAVGTREVGNLASECTQESCKRRCIGQLARLSLARKGLADPDPQREGAPVGSAQYLLWFW